MKTSLFVSQTDRLQREDWLTRRLAEALDTIHHTGVSPTLDVQQFERELHTYDFASSRSFDTVLSWCIGALERGGVQMTHPRYFGLFNPAPAYAAECADRIMAAINPQVCVLSHAPVAVLIERHVIATLGARFGFKTPGGHFTSGGSEANAASMICALTRIEPEFSEQGCRAFTGQPRLYVSRESHLAWLKIAHATGMGRDAVRLIDTDGTGRMDLSSLRETLERDEASGDVPVMIAATFGTTNAGMIDPIGPCADLAHERGLWLHVDAAWGGALIADCKQHDLFEGVERADSITVDAHKWFATTMGTGMFLTPHIGTLETSFHAQASYMPSGDAQVDYYMTSAQWSRRFSGLRLFLSLATGGWESYAAHVNKGQSLIRLLNERMRALDWQVANDSDMALTCLVPPCAKHERAAVVQRVVDNVIAGNDAWISVAQLEGQPVIRVCITNGCTEETDIDQLVKELTRACVD